MGAVFVKRKDVFVKAECFDSIILAWNLKLNGKKHENNFVLMHYCLYAICY